MFIQDQDVDGTGGFSIPAAKCPSWLMEHTHLYSWMQWIYRYPDVDSLPSSNRLPHGLINSGTNYFVMKMSNTSLTPRLKVAGTNYNYVNGGVSGNLTMATGEWMLVGGYFDPTATDVDTKIWSIRESDTDPTGSNNSAWPTSMPLSANLVNSLSLDVSVLHPNSGSQCWFGVLGPLVFWKGVQLAAADFATIWAARNFRPWTQAAAGNLPGPSHDGIFALTAFPGGNCGPRGGSNTNGAMPGDTIEDDHDVLVYRNETGVVSTGEYTKYEEGLTFPAGSPLKFFDGHRSDP